MSNKIVTENIYPPIPTRRFDWCAYFDGHEEHGPYGWGPTERSARAELLQTQGLSPEGKCIFCGRDPETAHGCSVAGCSIGEDA